MFAESPKRIWIVGPCGSGKSTLADRLGSRLGLRVTHIDEIHWKPGWIESDPDDEAARLAEIVAEDAWIIDGNYSRLRTLHHDRIQLAIWLDFPLSITFPRLLKRTFMRAITREVVCNGNCENPLVTMFSKDSILWWGLSTHNRRRVQLERELVDVPHIRVRSQREVADRIPA